MNWKVWEINTVSLFGLKYSPDIFKDRDKIHGWLPSGESYAGERYEPETPELEVAVLPTPAQRSEILGLLTMLFLLNRLKSLRETSWYSRINFKTWPWNIPGYYSGDTEEIHDGYPIKQRLCTALELLFQVLLSEEFIYFFIHKLQNSNLSTYVLLIRYVVHTPVSRRTDL